VPQTDKVPLPPIERIHSRLHARVTPSPDSIRSSQNHQLDQNDFVRIELAEHILNLCLVSWDLTDAHSNPRKCIALQGGHYRSQSVMTPFGPSPSHTYSSNIQMYVIDEDQNVIRLAPKPIDGIRNGETGIVHERGGPNQPNGVRTDSRGRVIVELSRRPGTCASQVIHDPEPDVVACLRVFRARIAEPDHNPGAQVTPRPLRRRPSCRAR